MTVHLKLSAYISNDLEYAVDEVCPDPCSLSLQVQSVTSLHTCVLCFFLELTDFYFESTQSHLVLDQENKLKQKIVDSAGIVFSPLLEIKQVL